MPGPACVKPAVNWNGLDCWRLLSVVRDWCKLRPSGEIGDLSTSWASNDIGDCSWHVSMALEHTMILLTFRLSSFQRAVGACSSVE